MQIRKFSVFNKWLFLKVLSDIQLKIALIAIIDWLVEQF